MPYADLGRARLFYTDEGEGQPILLIHGWSADGGDWAWQAPALLEAGFRCVIPDLRGHGHSPAPASGYTQRDYAADVAALAETLGLGGLIVMGHSQGGPTALTLARDYPALVRAIVSVDGSYGLSAAAAASLAGLAEQLKGPDGREVAQAFFNSAFYVAETPAAARFLHARRLAAFDGNPLWQGVAGLVSGPGQVARLEPAADCISSLAVPALSVRANAKIADWERPLWRHPKSKVVALTDVGHWLHQDKPAEFNEILLNWLATLD